MRQGVVVPGFVFIIVLLVIAGCTSPQTGSPAKNGIPGPGNTGAAPEQTFSYQAMFYCRSPPADPLIFKKFIPEVPGYSTDNRYNYRPFNKSTMIYDFQWDNSLTNGYISSSEKAEYRTRSIFVVFTDYGPCAGEYNVLDHLQNGRVNGTVSRVNFHGYPALHIQAYAVGGDIQDRMIVGVTDRLFVQIGVSGFHTTSFSNADADIENFGNAIDFRGFAASV